MNPARVLIVAGSDSGGGAGIQADIKTVTMLGGFAMTAIAALTAQNTLGVTGVMPVPADFVLAQIDAVIGDLGVDVVKLGMIGSAETANALAGRLERLGAIPIVFDPVMVASSGSVLADPDTVAAFERLLRVATVVTPNAPELAVLAGCRVESVDDLATAAETLAQRTGAAVLAKGGHLQGDMLEDLLVRAGTEPRRWQSARVDTRNTHGTGCTLASAIACGLGAGMALEDAVDRARAYVQATIAAAPGFGAGHGPMGHSLGADPFARITAAS
ncbi:bifunctional hydroxymethylpyrimidine kinase/phosphomethylpyrimidine kinase [Allosphingosinicella deserti]|uniref:hydroxymethylpyrimidine kinase n=1 Tax=Allosphingosinicella deserti TaxID=2116704 RepID=A0A2P7QY60_9SPHN|nr:bifunctional hydroxymethylpyrimidine kinase/phosphomethylpyrimidine kinase [Sphingomonas deserti]PSJ42896.1 bifunctional hydroxymethylpyrimidine kinase/phosphomethylpyrimidine kinase [Sphingomonas deserti]